MESTNHVDFDSNVNIVSTTTTTTDLQLIPTSLIQLQIFPLESTSVNMGMENSNYNLNIPMRGRRCGEIVITITTAHTDDSPPTQHPAPFPINDGGIILYVLYAVAIVVMYPSLTQLTQLKFLNNKPSPFETHTFLTNTSLVAYIIAIAASAILFYVRSYANMRERFSPAAYYYIYIILKTVFYLSGILAPLSLALVLLIPHTLSWIGYTIIFLVIVIIVVCNFNGPAKLLLKRGMSKLGIVR